ncbi:hypothetical protein ASD79_22660 [Caulobacter sp. Root655]|nr:hypothetical protein ASD79_22660 [Caulobacter sp. Root655]
MVASWARTPEQNKALAIKRVQVFLDHVKTLSFGFIGAAALTPTFRGQTIGPDGWLVIVVCGLILGLMVLFADHVR